MVEKEENIDSAAVNLNRNQLKLLHFVALKGEVSYCSLLKELSLTEPTVHYLLKNLSQRDMLIQTEKKGDSYYSVNAPEFLNQLNQMTNRVKTMINECNSLLGE